MPFPYKVYYIDENDRVTGMDAFEDSDDQTAIDRAKGIFVRRGAFELWQGDRCLFCADKRAPGLASQSAAPYLRPDEDNLSR
jgi:hypothetical protein